MLHMTRTRTDQRKVFRFAAAFLAGLSLFFMTGCAWVNKVFSLSGPQSTMVTDGPVAKAQWDLFMVTVWVTAASSSWSAPCWPTRRSSSTPRTQQPRSPSRPRRVTATR